MNSVKQCRWGILSTAAIGKKNWRAIRQSGNSVVRAVASRTRESAQKFIDECQYWEPFTPMPDACDSYEALLARDDIDAVYIPLPTGIRKEWVLRAAKSGKHVLAEKPAAFNAADVQEMLDCCKANNVQYMDGVMFMHSARLPTLRESIDDGVSIGNIHRITSAFSFLSDAEFRKHNIRSMYQYEPYGCLGDLGWYNVRMTLWVMDWQMPHSVSGREIKTLKGEGSSQTVPAEFTGDLFFENDVTANFFCSFLTQHQQWAFIAGEAGFIRLADFVLPFFGTEASYEVSNNGFFIEGCHYDAQETKKRIAVKEYANGRSTAAETNMIRTFSDYVIKGRPDPKWGEYTLKTQRILDALYESSKRNGEVVKL